MEREQIVKALDICANGGSCKECPINPNYGNYGYCTSLAINHALALIKELTEENEKLETATEEAVRSFTRLETLYKIECKRADTIKADTVREFAERLKRYYTALNDKSASAIICYHIDQIAKEMLGKECTSCKHFVGCECFDGKVCDLYEEGAK